MKRLHNFNSYNSINEAKGGELKIKDIVDAYSKNTEELQKARKELNDAQKKFNKIYKELGDEGEKLAEEYTDELLKKLTDKLNVHKVSDDESLKEIYVDGGKGKVSFHNRKYISNWDGDITFMIRTEQAHQKYKSYDGKLKEDFTPKEAAEYIFKQIKKFKEKYNFGIKWFK